MVSVAMRLLCPALAWAAFAHGHRHEHAHRHLSEDDECLTSPPSKFRVENMQKLVESFEKRHKSRRLQESVTIPVCFHVITPSASRGLITEDSLQSQLDLMNEAFSSASCCDDSLDFCNEGDCSIDTPFSFEMAAVDGNGDVVDGTTVPTVGDPSACVTYTQNRQWYWTPYFFFAFVTPVVRRIGRMLRKGDARVLNVVYKFVGTRTLGAAQAPWYYEESPHLDYVMVSGPDVNNPAGRKTTLPHEVGHWLGLWHPWNFGCDFSDAIYDTPRQSRPTNGCPLALETCPGVPGTYAPANWLDYSDDECRYAFTEGQVAIMSAAWERYRSTGGFLDPGIVDLTSGVEAGPYTFTDKDFQNFRLPLSDGATSVECSTAFYDPENPEMFCIGCENGGTLLSVRFDEIATESARGNACVSAEPATPNFQNCDVDIPEGGATELYVYLTSFYGTQDIYLTCVETVI